MALRFVLRSIKDGLSQRLHYWRQIQNQSGERSILDEIERELSQWHGDRRLAI
ncbi:MAG: hypothetical protein KME27_13050 [Lyngbya sp. HA4199-MV5]|nr:hypothetical protein [Lyngbya sp. HA4199-MV5]